MKKNMLWLMTMGLALGARAELQPEWEFGMGVGAVDFPIYRGAEERRTYVLPTPYVQYRGKFLRVERERVRGLLFRHDRVELDISVNGSVPVKSKDSRARQGMPDLDPTLELGPELQVHAERLSGDAHTILYGFRLEAAGRTVLSGRASVMLSV